MTTSHWRLRARQAIDKALIGLDRSDEATCRKAIDAAYPFGPREMWPYKMWLLERRLALKPTQAPDCPACGAEATEPCREIETGEVRAAHHASRSGPLFGGSP